MENSNPVIYEIGERKIKNNVITGDTDNDLLNEDEIFEHIRDIKDPEYDLTLEQLNVLSLNNIKCDNINKVISVFFKPTIPTCSTAQLIGLSIIVKLKISLSPEYKLFVYVQPESHNLEKQINKQLNDKERILASMENERTKEFLRGLWIRYMD